MSAARKLGQIYRNQKILLLDAQLAGEGASSRNSGYLVDTTLNDGFTSNKELENYKKQDPIQIAYDVIIKKKITTKKKLDDINNEVIKKIKDAADFSLKAPFPDRDQLYQDVYK